MKLLLVNTAHDIAQYGLFIDGQIKTSNNLINTKHSETALKNIDLILSENGLGVEDIDVFATCIGPGSFTGIRIGMSIIKGLMAGLKDKKLVVFSTLEAVAYAHNLNGLLLLPATKEDYYGADCKDGKVENLRVVKMSDSQEGMVYSYNTDIDKVVKLCLEKVAKNEFVDEKSISPMYLKLSQAENQLLGDKK